MDAAFGPAGLASVHLVGAIGSRAGQWVLDPARVRPVALGVALPSGWYPTDPRSPRRVYRRRRHPPSGLAG